MYLNASTRTRWILTAIAFGVFLLLVSVSVADAGGKVTVCHVPPGNPANAHTISIAEEAWNAGHSPHQSHVLDFIGKCPAVPTPPPTQVPPTATPWNEPTRPVPEPTVVPTYTGSEVCYAPAAEVCDSCANLERIANELARISDALEYGNSLKEANNDE